MKRTLSESLSGSTNKSMEYPDSNAGTAGQDPEVKNQNHASKPLIMTPPPSNANGIFIASSSTKSAAEEKQPPATEPILKRAGGDASKVEEVRVSVPSSGSAWMTSSASTSSSSNSAAVGSGRQTASQSFEALISAIENKDLKLIERLIEQGAPLIKPSSDERYEPTDNALEATIEHSCLEALPYLIKHTEINVEKSRCHYVYRACLEQSKELFDIFVNAGFTIDHLDEFPVRSSAVISYTSCYDTEETIFEMLFRAGANPNTVGPDDGCSSYKSIRQWADEAPDNGDLYGADIWNKCAATFEAWGQILDKPDAMKEAIQNQDFTRLENQVRHDLRSAEQRVDPEFMQSADSLNRLDMPSVAADLLRFPELTRPRTTWQPKTPAITGDPSRFPVTTTNGVDWRHKLLEAGFARPLIDFLEKKLGKNLELLAFIAPPPAPTSSGSDAIVHVHRATPSQVWSCLKFCIADLREESTLESLAAAYRGKGLTESTERKLVYQLKAQAIIITYNLSPENNVDLMSFERSVETLFDTCWQSCPSYAGGKALLELEAALREAGMFNDLAARVVKAWSEVLSSLNAGTFTPPVLNEEVTLLDTPQGQKMANLFGERLLANLDTQPSGLPPYPAFDPLPYMNALVEQLSLIKRFAQGAIEFTRTA